MARGVIERTRTRSYGVERSLERTIEGDRSLTTQIPRVNPDLLRTLKNDILKNSPDRRVAPHHTWWGTPRDEIRISAAGFAGLKRRVTQAAADQAYIGAPWFHDFISTLSVIVTGERPVAEGLFALGIAVLGGVRQTEYRNAMETGDRLLQNVRSLPPDTPPDDIALKVEKTLDLLDDIMRCFEYAYTGFQRLRARSTETALNKIRVAVRTGMRFCELIIDSPHKEEDVLQMISQWFLTNLEMFKRTGIQIQMADESRWIGILLDRIAQKDDADASPVSQKRNALGSTVLQQARNLAVSAAEAGKTKEGAQRWLEVAQKLMGIARSASYSQMSIGNHRYEEAAEAFERAGDQAAAAAARLERAEKAIAACRRLTVFDPAGKHRKQSVMTALNALKGVIEGLEKAFPQQAEEARRLMAEAIGVSLAIIEAHIGRVRSLINAETIEIIDWLGQRSFVFGLDKERQHGATVRAAVTRPFLKHVAGLVSSGHNMIERTATELRNLRKRDLPLQSFLERAAARAAHAEKLLNTARKMFLSACESTRDADAVLKDIREFKTVLEKLNCAVEPDLPEQRGGRKGTVTISQLQSEEMAISSIIMLVRERRIELAMVRLTQLASFYEEAERLDELAKACMRIGKEAPDFEKPRFIKMAAETYARAGKRALAISTWQTLGDLYFKQGKARHSADDLRLAIMAYRSGEDGRNEKAAASYAARVKKEMKEYEEMLVNFARYYNQPLRETERTIRLGAKRPDEHMPLQELREKLSAKGQEALDELLQRAKELQTPME